MPSRPTVLFYSNALGENIIADRGITSDSPAATRKVGAICGALQAAGVSTLIVSMGRGRSNGQEAYDAPRCGRLGRSAIVYGPLQPGKLLSLVATALWLCGMALRLRRRRQAVHLFYNQLALYLPALLLLRVVGARTALDLEDGPIGESNPAYRGNVPDWLFSSLITSGALVACTALAGATKVRPVTPIYGAIALQPNASAFHDQGQHHEVLYSGSVEHDTGATMLLEALQLINGTEHANRIRLHVTGAGTGMDALARAARVSLGPLVTVHGRVPLTVYRDLMARCSTGLSLKLKSGPFAQTTFPSKTIEYAEHGLTLITTDVSDVRMLFGDAALYVDDDSPRTLADRLIWRVDNSDLAAELAAKARRRLDTELSYRSVGAKLRAFFFHETAS